MKIKIGNRIFRTAKSIKRKLDINPTNDRDKKTWYYLNGIYDTRMLGIVIYRLIPSCKF